MHAQKTAIVQDSDLLYNYRGQTWKVVTLAEALQRRGFPVGTLAISEDLIKCLDTTLVAWCDEVKVQFVDGEPSNFVGNDPVLFNFAEVALIAHSHVYCEYVGTQYVVSIEARKAAYGTIKTILTLVKMQ